MEKLIHGDCMPILRKMDSDSVDLTVTDIPYGEVNRESNGLRNLDKDTADIMTFSLTEFVDQICRVTKGSIYIFCGQEQISPILVRLREHDLTSRQCIYEKLNASPMNGDKVWLSGIENIAFAKKPGAVFTEFCKTPVFRYPIGSSKNHPTEKPLSLIERLIVASSNEEDTVFDPCMGSGTTVIAAHRLRRHAIGIELDDRWFKVAEERWKAETAQIGFFDL